MQEIFSFLLASVLLTLSPGPDLLMVIGQSIEKGFRVAFIFVLGLVTGLCGHTLLLVVGWAQFIGEQPQIVRIAKGMGFVYFLYLGVRAIRQHFTQPTNSQPRHLSVQKSFGQGLFMNLINPKVSLFFWLFFPGFLFSNQWTIAAQYCLLGALFMIQALLVFGSVAYFSSSFKKLFAHYPMTLYTGLIWIVLGLYLLFDETMYL